MKYNLYSRIFRGYLKGSNNFIQNLVISASVNFLWIFILISIMTGIDQYIDELSDKLKVRIVFRNEITQDEIDGLLTNLKKNEIVSEIEYISPEKGVGRFSDKYQPDLKKLMLADDFPGISILSLNYEVSDDLIFGEFISLLRSDPLVSEIIYNKVFIDKYYQLRESFFNFKILMVILFALTLYLLNFRSFRLIFGNMKQDISTFYQTGVPFKFWFYPMLIMIFFSSLSVLTIIGFSLSIISVLITHNYIFLIDFEINSILMSLITALIFILVSSFISIVYLNLRRYAGN